MGHHYVPQKYLSRFEDPSSPGMVWLYDKQGGPARLVSIAKVAQSPEFYTPEDEASLAAVVEAPANPVIGKLVRQERLSDKERAHLSFYVAVMLRRVPYRRRKTYEEVVPRVLEETVAEVRSEIFAALEAAAIDPQLASFGLAQVANIHEKLVANPPEMIQDKVRSPWPTDRMVAAVHNLAWRVLMTSGPDLFMTTDNPAFFFEAYGIGNDESEITFPLASTHCLFASRQGPLADLAFVQSATQPLVREANRRVASTAERLGFYHANADFVQPLLQKRKPYLSRIQW